MDGIFKDGLEDAATHKAMGICGDDCAQRHSISRKEQDDYAINAYKRAAEAQKQGWFGPELVSVPITNAKGVTTTVSEDEEVKKVLFDKIPTLKPTFTPGTGWFYCIYLNANPE